MQDYWGVNKATLPCCRLSRFRRPRHRKRRHPFGLITDSRDASENGLRDVKALPRLAILDPELIRLFRRRRCRDGD